MKVKIEAIEYYLPMGKEDNCILQRDNPDWDIDAIEKKTGIKSRRISAKNETSVDMAIISAEKLFVAGIKKEEIDFLILVTQSSDYVLPTSACIIQDRLGLKKSCLSFDINMGCSGYIYGLMVAASMIEVGVVKKGFLICSETYSKYIDKNNRTCRPLFGDGAAATLLIACTDDKFGPFDLGTDGSGYSNLIVPASGARKADKDIEPRLFMDGASVFMFTMDMVPKSVNSLCEKARIAISDIDLFIFHQASRVVLENIVRRLGLDQQKVFVNNCEIGNTVSASIPIALKDAQSQNRLKRGNKVMLVGFGVGYSWGSCLINW